jgi:hypothetical protein
MASSRALSARTGPSTPLRTGFWGWYERHYSWILWGTTLLFFLQVIHLYWLGTHVIADRLLGYSLFNPPSFWQYLIIAVDYTEIPALISTSVLYFYDLQKRFSWKPVLFLILLNSQWLHLFWITDEFVLNQFSGRADTVLPVWLAWVAIMIDYLEVPVMVDAFIKSGRALKKKGLRAAIRQIAEHD